MDILKTESYKGHTIRIVLDDSPVNPRVDYDNLGTMVCHHGRYRLGDTHPYGGGNTLRELVSDIERKEGPILWMKLRMYDHGGIAMKAYSPQDSPQGYPWNCEWDSGWVGVIYVSRAKAREEWARKRLSGKIVEKVYDNMVAEVETYNAYLSGDCVGFEVLDANGETVDSCYGFLGDQDYCMQEAKSTVDHATSDTPVSA